MPSSSTNKLLASVSTDDFDWTAPRIRDPWGTKISRKTQQANRCRLFPGRGFASVVAVQSNGKQAEVGLVSREGMAGLPIVLGNHPSAHATDVQSARKGQARTCDGIAQGDPDQRIASRLVVEVRAGIRRANDTHRNLQRAVQVGRAIGAMAADGRRPSSPTVTSWASGSSDRRSREERHVRGDLPLANQVPHMLE
jgi:hypothetical protein